MTPVALYYRKEDVIDVLERGGVAIIAGGTGNPYFTTDSGAALRALEIGADALLKGTRVDGVYTADPEKDPTATRYDELTFQKALTDKLKVMDLTAYALCEQGPVPIIVFNIEQEGNLARLLNGEKIGTIVHA
jgi:uridylate kinase